MASTAPTPYLSVEADQQPQQAPGQLEIVISEVRDEDKRPAAGQLASERLSEGALVLAGVRQEGKRSVGGIFIGHMASMMDATDKVSPRLGYRCPTAFR